MQVVTVGPKYQIVIPKQVRKKMSGLKPGNKVSVGSVNDQTITIKTNSADWLEQTQGMMTAEWKGIDSIEELNKIRNEWESHIHKLGK